MKKKIIPTIIAIALIIVVIGVAGSMALLEKYSYSKEYRDLNNYFGVSDSKDVAIEFKDEILDTKAKLIDGYYYLDYDSVCSLLNARFYIDEHEKLLIYTTPDAVIQNPIGTNTFYVSGEDITTEYPITVMDGDKLLVALEFVKKYTNFSYVPFTEPNRILIKNQWGDIVTTTAKKDTWVRYQGGVKSDILKDVKENDKLVILEELEDWDKVKTEDGIIGYVEKKHLTNAVSESEIPVTDYVEEFSRIKKDYIINMAWHAIYSVAGNDTFDEYVQGTGTLSIISPTWYSLSDNEGNFTSFASKSYVDRAHARNMEVWAMVDNFNNKGVVTYEVMSYTSKRTKLIAALMKEAKALGFDGINLDFELVPKEAVPHYVQFIRELSVSCRRMGIVLSVDNYPPQGGSNYNLKEQGVFADYVVMMGYDEHWGSGGKAGPVASIGFVDKGINMILEQGVPADKLINAVPFYTRVWKTNGGTVTSDALGMKAALSFVKENTMEGHWDEAASMQYFEMEKNGTLYQIWLEDASSIETKLTVMKKYGLAGVSAWQLGQEDKAIWSVIDKFVKN